MISKKPTLKNDSIDDFINQAKDANIDKTPLVSEKKKQKPIGSDLEELKRQTYYITELQRQALAIMAAHEDIDKSEIIRQALEQFIPDKYIQMVLMK